MPTHQSTTGASLCLLLAACTAAPNPRPTNEPAPWRPPTSAKALDAQSAEKAKPEAPAVKSADTAAVKSAVADTVPTASSSANGGEALVARVGGEPVYVSELLTQWFYLENGRVRDQLGNLIMTRFVLAEANRLHVRIDPDEATQAYTAAVDAIENEIKSSSFAKKKPNLKLDEYVDAVLGLDPIRYRERLRDDALRSLLGQRVTRAWMLQQEHVDLHVIVVGNEEDLKAAQKDLADGIAFETVAKNRSIDPSKAEGGLITPIVKSNTSLSKLAFETPIGKVGGPVSDAGAWLLLRVDDRPAPVSGDWSTIGAAVEASLKKRPVEPLEVKQWHSAMVGRYEVDQNPFFDLVGEPRR